MRHIDQMLPAKAQVFIINPSTEDVFLSIPVTPSTPEQLPEQAIRRNSHRNRRPLDRLTY